MDRGEDGDYRSNTETYYFRRYRRIGPARTTGPLADEVKFTADSASEAEASVRRRVHSSIGAMDWEKYFARLEDEYGHVIAEWQIGFSHA
jgi:hypothetical protein